MGACKIKQRIGQDPKVMGSILAASDQENYEGRMSMDRHADRFG
jgi:hypothetical protein